MCQLARRGPKCGCKTTDTIPPESLRLHEKLNQPLSPQLDGPAPALSRSRADGKSDDILELARELNGRIAAGNPIFELWRKLHDKLHESFDNANPVSTRVRGRESSPDSGIVLGSSSRQRPMAASSSIDLPIKKHRAAADDSSHEFRSQDSKSGCKRMFGGDSNEWNGSLSNLSPASGNQDLSVNISLMTFTDQTTTDGGCSHASARAVQNDKSGSGLSLAGLSLSEFSSLSSFINLSDTDSNSKPCDHPDVPSL